MSDEKVRKFLMKPITVDELFAIVITILFTVFVISFIIAMFSTGAI